ncbi:MAG: FHA domain-containing protein [Woeseiaceae bacterium]
MANDNKNIKELVSDDNDRTAELETPTWRESFLVTDQEDLIESDATTFDVERYATLPQDENSDIEVLKADLRAKLETIDRLQFDVERLRSRRTGLETEVRAREAQTLKLSEALDQSTSQIEALNGALRQIEQSHRKRGDELDAVQRKHAEEIRTLRFELTAAEDTMTQHEMINEQLASDLVDTRGFKVELERMLTESEGQNRARIAELEREVSRLVEANNEFERELADKNETIRGLLDDLSSKSRQKDSLKDLEAAIHELDDRVTDRVEERPAAERERLSRVLIGNVDNQELRFPLFKSRLTIGRAAQNDIQLQAAYVSRRHAVVVTEGETTRVVDWGSKNGVYVNSRRVTEHFLTSGDILSVGDAEFRYEERAKR